MATWTPDRLALAAQCWLAADQRRAAEIERIRPMGVTLVGGP